MKDHRGLTLDDLIRRPFPGGISAFTDRESAAATMRLAHFSVKSVLGR